MSKFKIGDTCRVIKPYTNGVLQSEVGKIGIKYARGDTLVHTFLLGVDGCWNDDELELVRSNNKENKTMKERRTFKLLQESPSLLQGALVQERCDDSTQPYDLINAETHSKDPSFNVSFAKRELVEDAPKFWVEVFKVEPEYMEKEQLDRYNAFVNGTKRPVGRPKGSTTKKAGRKNWSWSEEQRAAHSRRMKQVARNRGR